jgi:hypothetical protein
MLLGKEWGMPISQNFMHFEMKVLRSKEMKGLPQTQRNLSQFRAMEDANLFQTTLASLLQKKILASQLTTIRLFSNLYSRLEYFYSIFTSTSLLYAGLSPREAEHDFKKDILF